MELLKQLKQPTKLMINSVHDVNPDCVNKTDLKASDAHSNIHHRNLRHESR